MAALPVRRSPSRRSPSAVASQRGRGRERRRQRSTWMDATREGGSARAPCAATVSSAPLVGPSIHPSSGRQRARRAGLPFPTEDEDDECDHGGGVCWLSRPHLPRKPPNSTDKVSPHFPHRHCRRPPIDLPRSLPFSHSFLHSRRDGDIEVCDGGGTAFASRRQVALHSHPLIAVPARSGMAALG